MRSVLEQGYPSLEYVVVDGGFERRLARRSCAATGTRWRTGSPSPTAGRTRALIKGFGRCSGDVCGWLCSDDLLLPGALARPWARSSPRIRRWRPSTGIRSGSTPRAASSGRSAKSASTASCSCTTTTTSRSLPCFWRRSLLRSGRRPRPALRPGDGRRPCGERFSGAHEDRAYSRLPVLHALLTRSRRPARAGAPMRCAKTRCCAARATGAGAPAAGRSASRSGSLRARAAHRREAARRRLRAGGARRTPGLAAPPQRRRNRRHEYGGRAGACSPAA